MNYRPTHTDPDRGTGRTTAGMLRALAEAIEAQGGEVEYRDHDWPMTLTAARGHAQRLQGMADRLGLAMRVRSHRYRVMAAGKPRMALEQTDGHKGGDGAGVTV